MTQPVLLVVMLNGLGGTLYSKGAFPCCVGCLPASSDTRRWSAPFIALAAAIVGLRQHLTPADSAEGCGTRQTRSKRDQLASAPAGELSGILHLFSRSRRMWNFITGSTHRLKNT